MFSLEPRQAPHVSVGEASGTGEFVAVAWMAVGMSVEMPVATGVTVAEIEMNVAVGTLAPAVGLAVGVLVVKSSSCQ